MQLIPIETIGLPTGASYNAIKKPADAEGKITDENGNQWKFRADRFGLLTQSTTPLGNTTTLTRNQNGLPVIEILPDPDDVSGPLSSSVYYFGYSAANDTTFQQNSIGGKQTAAYNSLSRVTSTVDEVGRTQSFTFDSLGNMLTSVDGGGFTTTYAYNSRGQVTSVTAPDPDGAGTLTSPVTSYAYSSTTGQLLTLTNPDASTEVFTYNTADQPLTVKDELNKTTTLTYDSLGRMATLKDRLLAITTFTYDSLSRMTRSTDPQGNQTDYTFNNRGWISSIAYPDPDGAGALGRPTDNRTYDFIGQILSTGVAANNYNTTSPFTYDADGRQITKADPSNYSSLEQYTYDKQGRLIIIQDPGMNETVMTYDGDGNLLSRVVQGFSGGGPPPIFTSESAAYSLADEMILTTDGRGNSTSYAFNSRGLLSTETLPDPDGVDSQFGRLITHNYDNMGRETSTNLGYARTLTYVYNSRSWITRQNDQDPDGAGSLTSPTVQYAYNKLGSMTSQTHVLSTGNRVTNYTYDNEQRVLTVTDPDPDGTGSLTPPVTTATYNNLGWLVTLADQNGGVTTVTYDNLGRYSTVTQPDPDGAGSLSAPVTNYVYDAQGLFKVTDPMGHYQTVARDAAGRVTSQTDPVGNVTAFEYDYYSKLKKRTDPDPDGAGSLTSPVTTLIYDAAHRLNSKTDPMSGTTSYGYDAASNVTTLTDSVGNTTNFGYDGQNQLVMATNSLSKTKSYDYDIAGNLMRTTDRNGKVIQYVRDYIDRVTDEKWQNTTTEATLTVGTSQQGGAINEIQRVGWTTSGTSVGGTFTLSYNGATTSAISSSATANDVRTALEALSTVGGGNVAVELPSTPPGSADRTYKLTFQGSKAATNVPQTTTDVTGLSISPPMGTSITAVNATDATGGTFSETQTLVLANATAGTWRLAYNGQVTSRLQVTATASQVDTALEALSGIGSGNLTTTGSAGNFTITFTGSKANTNMLQVFGDASTAYSGTTTRTITTTYNNAREVASISDPAATITCTRDNLGRATTVSNSIAGLTPTVDFSQVFDAANNRTQLTAVIGGTNDFKNDYSYDALNRLTEIKQQGNGGNTVGDKHVTIGYNGLGQRTSLSRYESLTTSSFVGTTNWGYDSANRLSTLDHIRGGTTFASYAYSYDGMSRLTSINSSVEGVSNFTYDSTSQITAADHTSQTDETYSYDLNGNRNSTGFTTGTNNQTLTGGGYTYTYDDEGNRKTRTDGSNNVQDYTWDYRNRLVTVKDKDPTGTVVKQVDYTYDALNRLVKRSYDADGAGLGTAIDQFWAYDEGINALVQFDGSTASDMTHRYLWSDQIDELLADSQLTSLSSAGNALWAMSDHLNTIRDIADYDSGTDTTSITNHRTYNVYGKLVSETDSAVDLLFGFTGKQLDEATGLQHNLFRWYDSNLGQWLSEDPISFAAGDENIKRYVKNGHTKAVDQLGLQEPTYPINPQGPTSMPSFDVRKLSEAMKELNQARWRAIIRAARNHGYPTQILEDAMKAEVAISGGKKMNNASFRPAGVNSIIQLPTKSVNQIDSDDISTNTLLLLYNEAFHAWMYHYGYDQKWVVSSLQEEGYPLISGRNSGYTYYDQGFDMAEEAMSESIATFLLSIEASSLQGRRRTLSIDPMRQSPGHSDLGERWHGRQGADRPLSRVAVVRLIWILENGYVVPPSDIMKWYNSRWSPTRPIDSRVDRQGNPR